MQAYNSCAQKQTTRTNQIRTRSFWLILFVWLEIETRLINVTGFIHKMTRNHTCSSKNKERKKYFLLNHLHDEFLFKQVDLTKHTESARI